eukprot:COSAG02_NODE_312_length_24941_cov_60.672611_14_plen_76_part_00
MWKTATRFITGVQTLATLRCAKPWQMRPLLRPFFNEVTTAQLIQAEMWDTLSQFLGADHPSRTVLDSRVHFANNE